MAQETQIKVKIDDNEALQSLREMASLVEQISETMQGLKVPPGAIPSQPPTPSETPSEPDQDDREEEKRISNFRRILKQEGQRAIETLTSTSTLGSLTQQTGAVISNIGKAIGGWSGGAVAATGQFMKIVSRSLALREQKLGEVIGLEAQEAEIRGLVDVSDPQKFAESRSKELAKLGLDPSASRSLIAGVAGAIGLRSTDADLSPQILSSLAASERSGVGAGAIASLAGTIAQNTGSRVGQALKESLELRNIAEQQLDLRGPGVERFLGGIGGIVDSLTAQGMFASTPQIGRSLTGIAAATGRKGMRPMQIFQGLQGVGRGAFSQISAPLQGLAQQIAVADIFARSGSFLEAQQKAEILQQDPLQVSSIISRTLGGGADAQSVLASIQGIGTQDAGGLLSARSGRRITTPRLSSAQVSAGLQLGAAQAQQAGKTIRSLRDDPKDTATFKKMIELAGQSERSVLKMSENVQTITKLMDQVSKVQSLTTSAIAKINQMIDRLARLLP